MPVEVQDNDQSKSIVASSRTITSLSASEREQLYGLMSNHFQNVRRDVFFSDLDEKQSVILITNPAAAIVVGFATLGLLKATVDGRQLAAVFAGDTVIEPYYWGHHAWIRAWSQKAFELAKSTSIEPVYFLLLTSTHRSYRFLPGFFREYYPRPDSEMPETARVYRDALVRRKFPQEYDDKRGLVIPQEAMPVREERIDPAAVDRQDESVQFFREANPGYARGDYLVCITELSAANLTRLGRRMSDQ